MIKILKLTGLVIGMVLSISMPSWGEVEGDDKALVDDKLAMLDSSEQLPKRSVKQTIMDRVEAIQGINPRQWGIGNGCINSSRIRKMKFLDDQTAILTLRGKKKALLRLETACPGIKRGGFARVKDGPRLCRKFDRFNVLGGNFSCRVASIDPYVELVDPPGAVSLD